ncbi:hypothetical protein [Entomobacter blattae]|uniref:CopC domain-containing protein n=1 Tax=Entomobacter blattae TaxID=2762277 RepID=A0A7H1NPK6_9PROT|nr:hypothetical protein [Entomobacter blattae]QNT77716.1 hypothetical protein JGUZn3_04670 [Entomobacter blattae]
MRSYILPGYNKITGILVFLVGIGLGVFPPYSARAIELVKVVPTSQVPLSLHHPILTFYFNEKFNPFKSRVELIEAKGPPQLLTMVPSDDYKALRTKLQLPVGHYSLRWHVQTWEEEKANGVYSLIIVP